MIVNFCKEDNMHLKPLGGTGLSVAPLAFGGNVFGWTADEAASFALLDAFTDSGLNLIDTADVYSAWVPGNRGGESERIIGNWLKKSGKRDRVVLATKVGMEMGDGSKGLGREHIVKSVEDSLKRLQTDVIDLYMSHLDDAATPLEESLAAYDLLIGQGKVRAIGASNHGAARLKEALDTSRKMNLPSYSVLEPEYNIYDRPGFEDGLEAVALGEGLGVISYYSLASGFLTGKYRTREDLGKSVRGGMIGERYLNERGLRILAALDEVAAAHGTTPAVIALAWLMQRQAVTAAIASATSVPQLSELVKATMLVLGQEDVRRLDEASA